MKTLALDIAGCLDCGFEPDSRYCTGCDYIIMKEKPMTYDEALQALKDAQKATWYWDTGLNSPEHLKIHDGITRALEVFKRMKTDLDYWKKYGQDTYDKSLTEGGE